MIQLTSNAASVPRSQAAVENASSDRFRIMWRNGAYYVSVPEYHGGEVVRAELSDALQRRIERLEADLNECREFIENYVDVNDGDYGEPAPNRAMSLVSMIDETLNGRPY